MRDLIDRPDDGWIREIREALGMSTGQLAKRMGVTQSAVSRLEQSEKSGRAQIATLRRAAAALDCTLIYALMPRRSLERTMFDQAVALATTQLGPPIEGADTALRELRIEHIAGRLVDKGEVWAHPEPSDSHPR